MLATVRFEGDECREMVSKYDQNCHNQNEAAMVSVRMVNRLANLYNTELLFTGDDTERFQVADCCLDVVIKIFQNRMM